MEAKCNLCELFGNKTHCRTCKVLGLAREHTPQEIDCSLEDFIEYIENTNDVAERYGVGDYKNITLYTGEEVKMIVLDVDKDQLASGGTAKVTLGILEMEGLYTMDQKAFLRGGWRDCLMRKRMERFFKLLPPILQAHIKPVIKLSTIGSCEDDIVSTNDKLFLFSESEIFGLSYSTRSEEGMQYEYFKFPINRQFNGHKWLRTTTTSYYFLYTRPSPPYVSSACNTGCFGVAFGFCI